MKTTSFLAVALLSLTSTVYSAPTPQLSNIIGSITNPTAGSGNTFGNNGNGNGNENGNHNEAGNNNGNDNTAGSGNEAGNNNKFDFGSILKARNGLDPLEGVKNTIGSITNPGAGNDNKFFGNGNDNGNGNGNGNSAGNNNGNGNEAGNNNQAGNGNSFTVSPEFPDIDISPTINLARSSR